MYHVKYYKTPVYKHFLYLQDFTVTSVLSRDTILNRITSIFQLQGEKAHT